MFVKGGSSSAFTKNKLQLALKKENITLDEFNILRLTDVNKLSPEQVLKMKNIRDAVPVIDNTTMIQKTIPFEDIEKYNKIILLIELFIIFTVITLVIKYYFKPFIIIIIMLIIGRSFYDFFLKFNISYRVSGALSILLINVMVH